jgi:16S rRNA processing protein RimM
VSDQQQGDIEVVVGRIGKPHGIRGEVTLDVRTDEPDRRFAPGTTIRAEAPAGADRRPSALTVTRARWHQGTLLVTFEELADRNAAEAVRGTLLYATLGRDEVPEDPDEYYDHQLVGLDVVDVDGTPLGTVKAIVHGSAQDLLTVRTPDGRDALVPFVAALVPEVDLAAGRLVVADRPGLVSPFPDEQGPDEQGPDGEETRA